MPGTILEDPEVFAVNEREARIARRLKLHNEPTVETLAGLLREAASAYSAASLDEYDVPWPVFYAEYLLGKR